MIEKTWKREVGLFLVLSFFLSFFVFGPLANAEEGLAGYWNFNEGTGDVIKDSSGNGNDGKIYGAIWVSGKKGNDLSFNGQDNYVALPANPSFYNAFAQPARWTIEMWVKPESISP